MLPFLQDFFRLVDQGLAYSQQRILPLSPHPGVVLSSGCVYSYSLLSRLAYVLVGLEERSNIDCLAAPEVSVDCPVEGELEGAAVEVPVEWQRC